MRKHDRILEHPTHTMTIVAPIGLWMLAPLRLAGISSQFEMSAQTLRWGAHVIGSRFGSIAQRGTERRRAKNP